MALHINKPSRNIINTKISKPKKEFQDSSNKKTIHYATVRTDKRLICKIKALNMLLNDKTIADTLQKILKVSIPKFIKGKDKIIFDADYKMWMNRIK